MGNEKKRQSWKREEKKYFFRRKWRVGRGFTLRKDKFRLTLLAGKQKFWGLITVNELI